jgi:hypothetical protein
MGFYILHRGDKKPLIVLPDDVDATALIECSIRGSRFARFADAEGKVYDCAVYAAQVQRLVTAHYRRHDSP